MRLPTRFAFRFLAKLRQQTRLFQDRTYYTVGMSQARLSLTVGIAELMTGDRPDSNPSALHCILRETEDVQWRGITHGINRFQHVYRHFNLVSLTI